MFLGSSNSILVPAEIAVIIYLLYDSLGPATFAGLGIILLMLPFLGLILVKLLKYHRLRLGLADKRVKLSSEILQGIRILKFYGSAIFSVVWLCLLRFNRVVRSFFQSAWEDSFLSRVNGLRQSELDILRKYNIYQSLIIVVFLVLPVWMSLTTFGVFAGTGHVMTAGAVFRAVALFNALRFPLINLPGALSSLMSGTVSVKRVQAFLAAEDIGDNRRHIVGSALGAPGTAASSPSTETADAETASTAKSPVDTKVLTSELASFENSYFVRNATYKWQLNQPVPSLVNVSVKVPKGKLVGIVGLASRAFPCLFGIAADVFFA
jgi:ABC-type multidrug transport system fused ATPase/permease subunit